MIIRHDLKLVFLHVPKCAGKELRKLFRLGADEQSIEQLFNYGHSTVLDRYVDYAHMPLSDLCTTSSFQFLQRYRVVACVRNPYKRLPSAANEFYRQKSKRHERRVIEGTLTAAMRERYYRKLRLGHSQLDPRFIHSLPMHRFTHLGMEPMVDHLLHCEQLRDEVVQLSIELNWPAAMRLAAADLPATDPAPNPQPHERTLANELYERDFEWFGYAWDGQGRQPNAQSEETVDAGRVRWIHRAEALAWHWGPTAKREERRSVPACRENPPVR